MTSTQVSGRNGEGSASSMVDDAYASLLAAISEARLSPGTPLSQNKLAARLGVSRTPVREALLRLESEGLVERLGDSGFIVASATPEAVIEACSFLRILDAHVYLEAMHKLPDDSLEMLIKLAQRLVRSAKAQDSEAWKEADAEFHSIILSAVHNRYINESLQQMRRQLHRFWVDQPVFDGRLKTCSEDHVAMAKALRARDPDALQRRVNEHVDGLQQSVLARLESARPLLPNLGGVAALTR